LVNAQTLRRVIINPVVLAELTVRYTDFDLLLEQLNGLSIQIEDRISKDAAFLAGEAHRSYRMSGGQRTTILADFLIGGHAQSLGAAILTRDTRRFAGYFPSVELITPETTHG